MIVERGYLVRQAPLTIKGCCDLLTGALPLIIKADKELQRSCLEQELLFETSNDNLSSSVLQIVNQTTHLL